MLLSYEALRPWQYPQRLGIRRLRPDSDSEAWHAIEAILCLVSPWQYPPRLGMLFYILSRLGSILRLVFGGLQSDTDSATPEGLPFAC